MIERLGIREVFAQDWRRAARWGSFPGTSPGFWAVCVYRVTRWIRSLRWSPFRLALKVPARCAQMVIQLFFDITLDSSAEIGPGLQIVHPGGVRLAPGVRMGRNVTIVNEVTVGRDGRGNSEVPVIGDNVLIGVGARILGGVRVGSNVVVGANAVVIKDVPDNGLAVGVPARYIPKDVREMVR